MADTATPTGDEPTNKGILGWVERTGNKLPDPVLIFVYLILALAAFSVVAELISLSVTLSPEILRGMSEAQKTRFDIGDDGVILAKSLLAPENIRLLLVEMPKTFTHYPPLGYVLVVMLGAGVAERTGLFSAAMRAGVRGAPKYLLTPVVAIIAMMGNHAADSAYVVLIPLAGALYAAAGRHPVLGIGVGFAAVSGGFSANLFPGQLDALLFGITEPAAQLLQADWPVNIAGNWFFIAGIMVIYVPVIWFVGDVIIEKRLGPWRGGATPAGTASSDGEDDDPKAPLSPAQKKGLRNAGLVTLAVVAVWVFLVVGPGSPLIDSTALGPDGEPASLARQLSPLFTSLVAGFLVLFLAAGVAYGVTVGTIKSHKDTVGMMSNAMSDMAYYLVLAFASAHFVAMFAWSNLGLVFAVGGADAIQATGLQSPLILMVVLVLMAGFVNLFIGSASAKWAILAPVLVPMFMLLGVSPEATTAAFRVGDSATNIITPLMPYFPLVLIYAQRWDPKFGLGSLTAIMLPFSIWMMIVGILLTGAWVFSGSPLGPGAPVTYALPTAG